MTNHWATALRTHWGLEARLSRLDGEYDLNFLVEATNGQDYVLKVMRAGCDAGLVDLQIKALEHVASEAPGLPFPKVFPDLQGTLLPAVLDETEQPRLVWLQQRLPGRCYAKAAPISQGLILKLGRVLGATDRALERFSHPGLHRDAFKWDLAQAGWITDKLDAISDPAWRALLDEVVHGFQSVAGTLNGLPAQAIHNDANDYNILVEGDLNER
ncbi:MAG: phosphotransferase, partial [Ruegeria sp.]